MKRRVVAAAAAPARQVRKSYLFKLETHLKIILQMNSVKTGLVSFFQVKLFKNKILF
jgi:hypothetical protein